MSTGRVYLVGAGPGDPGLLTARALELIALADVILYDRLIPEAALDGARADSELVFVGKEGAGDSVPQDQTLDLLLARARAGRTVVRLKGGDPFVFGRGGEEALALREAGIPFEVVPGVTAGVAASAYAGIPVTHRGLASAVAFVTGHTREDADEEIDWNGLARFPGTLVFYMGVRELQTIAAALIDAGRPPQQAAAVVEAGTLATQRTVRAPLAEIASAAREHDVRAPAITLVGEVARMADVLAWLPDRPLAGVSVVVTRARERASGLSRSLRELGARVIEAPAIRTQPLDGPALDPSAYDLICLTSPNAVAGLFARLAAGGRDARALAGIRIAAIGPGTSEALTGHGVIADIVPTQSTAEGLVEALQGVEVRRALIPRALIARDVLPDSLRARGAEVEILPVYETLPAPLSERTRRAALDADYVTFTSSSTVRNFIAVAGPDFSARTRLLSIGPATTATLREHGLEPHVEARRHDVEGVVQALLDDKRAGA